MTETPPEAAYGPQNAARIAAALGQPAPIAPAPKPAVTPYAPPCDALSPVPAALPKVNARGRHKTGEMNGTEKAYAEYLTRLSFIGEVVWWRFESVVFTLAPKVTYRPDFLVMLPCGLVEIHETKGHMEDDAACKTRMFSSLFPFPIYVIKRDGGEWVKKEW